jgi:hypothetical protein
MEIKAEYPPNFSSIKKAFAPPHTAIFCYGGTIYNPSNQQIPPHLVEHEQIHSAQQGDDPAGWWEEYISSPAFRVHQEVAAHIAEYNWFIRNQYGRQQRRRQLSIIAKRLSGRLYGRMITLKEARTILKGAVK